MANEFFSLNPPPQPGNPLGIMDVYDPMKNAQMVLQANALKDKMDEAKIFNRIYSMQADTMQEERNAFTQMAGSPALQMRPDTQAMKAQPQQPQGNALAGMGQPQNMGQSNVQAKMVERALKQKQVEAAIQEQQMIPLRQDAMSRLISSTPGTEEFEKAKADYFRAGGKDPAVIKSLLGAGKTDKPLSDIGKLQFDRKRLIDSGVSEDDPQVKAYDAEIKKKSEASEPKEPASTEANYRQGLEKKMRDAHPDWPKEKIQFEAAAQVRKENIQNQRANFEIRIPTQQQATDMPPGYTFDRRSGKFRSPDGSLVSPNDFSKLYADKAEMLGEKRAMGDLIKREQLIKTFTNRIDANVDLFNNFKTGFKNNWPRIANKTIREAYAGAIGSGDVAALRQILFSIESEVAKVETGNIGISGVAEGAREITAKIHDLNMPIHELEKVLDMSKKLGKTASGAMQKQRQELKGDLSGKPVQPKTDQKKQTIGRFTVETE